MLRFLKYIFLIFGSLALGIMIFFYFQNKEDLGSVWNNRKSISYEVISKECPDEHYNCFKERFDAFSSKVSLTGLSLGLKLGFNYLEESKEKSDLKYKDIEYALRHLELNNTVIKYTNNLFFGFEKLYGGYIGKMIDFLAQAKDFSNNLIIGLTKSENGIDSVQDIDTKIKFEIRLNRIREELDLQLNKIQQFINREVERIEKLQKESE